MIDLDKSIIGLIKQKAECLNVHQGFYAKLHNVTARTTRNTPALRWEYSISIDDPSTGLHCLKEFVWDGCIDEGVDRKAPEIFEDLFTKVIESINGGPKYIVNLDGTGYSDNSDRIIPMVPAKKTNPAYDPENSCITISGEDLEHKTLEGHSVTINGVTYEAKYVITEPLPGLPSYHTVNGELVNSETGIKKSEEVDFNKVKIL